MSTIFNFTFETIDEASELILKNLGNTKQISYKEKGEYSNLVTNVDHAVEKLIIKKIQKRFPSHSIVAEESGTLKKDYTHSWFIDPIDGTTNFAHGYPFFCISIAYAREGKLEVGFVKNPITKELYYAERNKGAFLNKKLIKVSKIKDLSKSLLATGFPYSRTSKLNNFKRFTKLTLASQGVRRDGAAALDLCYVACGKLDGFWESHLNPWDVAAGVLIIKEAGGIITDFKGNNYDIFNPNIVASNGSIHKKLLGCLH